MNDFSILFQQSEDILHEGKIHDSYFVLLQLSSKVCSELDFFQAGDLSDRWVVKGYIGLYSIVNRHVAYNLRKKVKLYFLFNNEEDNLLHVQNVGYVEIPNFVRLYCDFSVLYWQEMKISAASGTVNCKLTRQISYLTSKTSKTD